MDVAREVSLAIPHYITLLVLDTGVVLATIAAWVLIAITGHHQRGLFNYTVGVMRWHNRFVGYAFALATDHYPPFRLSLRMNAHAFGLRTCGLGRRVG